MKLNLSKKTAALIAGVGTLVSAAVVAGPMYFQEIHYYSDATYTQGIGDKTITCTGLIVVDGQISPYYKVVYKAPCGGSGGGDL